MEKNLWDREIQNGDEPTFEEMMNNPEFDKVVEELFEDLKKAIVKFNKDKEQELTPEERKRREMMAKHETEW